MYKRNISLETRGETNLLANFLTLPQTFATLQIYFNEPELSVRPVDSRHFQTASSLKNQRLKSMSNLPLFSARRIVTPGGLLLIVRISRTNLRSEISCKIHAVRCSFEGGIIRFIYPRHGINVFPPTKQPGNRAKLMLKVRRDDSGCGEERVGIWA